MWLYYTFWRNSDTFINMTKTRMHVAIIMWSWNRDYFSVIIFVNLNLDLYLYYSTIYMIRDIIIVTNSYLFINK